MLRISIVSSNHSTTLKLEGKLLRAWCDELRSSAAATAARGLPVRLDLHDVSFLDDDGAQVVRALIAEGATLDRRSNFVAEFLNEERV
jgi:anti-anti-sigma regulatory factor